MKNKKEKEKAKGTPSSQAVSKSEVTLGQGCKKLIEP